MIVEQKGRIVGLDSLRGIAAMIVVFNHFCLAGFPDFYQSFWYKWTPVHWLFDGRISVILFFVLSGFVLTAPIMAGKNQSYSHFLIRRFARVYLPFLFSMLVAACLWLGVTTLYPERHFEWNEWAHDISWTSFLSHIFATGMVGSNYLNPPIWTLVLELRVAIIFPLLVWLVRKSPFLSVIGSVILGYLSSKLLKEVEAGDNLYYTETILGSVLLTVYYIQFFIFGIFIATKIEWIKSILNCIPEKIHYVLIGVMFLVPMRLFGNQFILREIWYSGMAIYLVVSCVLFATINQRLMWGPFKWVGNVSFSLYLIHTPIILALIYILLPYLPIWGILLISFPIILIASHVMYKQIEAPCHRLGKKWISQSADKNDG